jgi:vancomycin resistance protein VanJ
VAQVEKTPGRLRRWAVRGGLIYLVAAVGCWLFLCAEGDVGWVGTVLLFGPRWVALLPLVVLAPLAAVAHSWRAGGVLAAAALVVVGPLMGGTVSPSTSGRSDDGAVLRVLTCNTDGQNLHKHELELLVAQTLPDIVALQEAEVIDFTPIFPDGWHIEAGPAGLLLATRFPIRGRDYLTEPELGARGAVGRYRLETPAGELIAVNVHLPTPREGFEEVLHTGGGAAAIREGIAARDHASIVVRSWLGDIGGDAIVAGDFNMPVESAIYRRHWSDLTDAFSKAGWGWGYTKQTRWFGVRIDHVLAGKAWTCRRAWVGPDVGSDHLPLIAQLEYVGAGQ